ncbi:hypothetical protein EMIHUDRAFT_193862 [Emiliania huxleyi CCMP1516]|uniref:Uncharacterized protein n=2 Tax=Emiliania huxleyi TaxID=2903 RepID=A0A0D3L0J2_EMIH1|nr:hypothetical protein EMIHUDRAFT_193862 [Emiliania huxleyi CCMP1516]EOD41527.1 hypothetical protein EMIHUDRAFT_193862 [Emiliania huxleyi CCMP1516]|eukprot:XP_005793956.1 hypothetical protein EMIHUDRAFT_193862 [Emiliania huxleyi CCMP1516]
MVGDMLRAWAGRHRSAAHIAYQRLRQTTEQPQQRVSVRDPCPGVNKPRELADVWRGFVLPRVVAMTATVLCFRGSPNATPEPRSYARRPTLDSESINALTVERARALLRGGADSSAGEPSALERARVLCSWGESDPTVAAVGSTVAIHSLVSRPSMNGKVGVVVSASASTCRFGVRVTGEAKALALRRAMQWSLPDSPDPLFDTPLPSLRPANLEPAAEAVEAGRLVLKAAEWSPQSHELFPEAARKRAVEVMRLGYLIAWDEERFDSREGAAPELADIWRGFVLPRVVVR